MRRRKRSEETSVLPQQEASGFFDMSAPPGWGYATATGAGAGTGAGADPASIAADSSNVAPSNVAVEAVVLQVRRHGRHLVPAVILLFIVAGAAGYFIGWFPELWMNVTAAAVAAVLFIFGGIMPILRWMAHRAVITTRRVILHRGFFVRHRTEVSLARVREVRSKQNPIQRMWKSGDLDLFVGAEANRIHDAPRAHDLQSALQELSERSYDEQLRASSFGS